MLTGDLKDFSLREILQFLGTTSSSGVLELRNPESHAGIAVHDGGICLALLDMDGIRGLAARMIRSGTVDVARLRELGADSEGGAFQLATVLATETAADTDAAAVFREYTVETLGWLTRRDDARFAFEGAAGLGAWPFDPIALGEAFDAVAQREADWQALDGIVGDLTRVCSPAPEIGADDEVVLTAEQWRVLALVDGRRRLKDLIEVTGIGHLETCRVLDELVTFGLIEMVAADEASALDELLGGLDALRPHGAPAAPAAPVRQARSPSPRDPRGEPAVQPAAAPRPTVAVAAPAAPAPEPAAPTGPAAATAVDDGEAAAPTDDANRALFDRLMGGGGAAP